MFLIASHNAFEIQDGNKAIAQLSQSKHNQ